ncbi:Uncharacterised protein [Vibrio cholerae]|nr:Uncharacterised protein [Vibrio cholerae]
MASAFVARHTLHQSACRPLSYLSNPVYAERYGILHAYHPSTSVDLLAQASIDRPNFGSH